MLYIWMDRYMKLYKTFVLWLVGYMLGVKEGKENYYESFDFFFFKGVWKYGRDLYYILGSLICFRKGMVNKYFLVNWICKRFMWIVEWRDW